MHVIIAAYTLLLLFGPSLAAASSPDPTNDDQKTLYALGLALSQSLGTFTLNETELDFVKSGLTDGVLKKQPKVDLQTYGPKINQLGQARAGALAEIEKRPARPSSRRRREKPAPRKRNRAPSLRRSRKAKAPRRKPPTPSKCTITEH
jgi:hypothetical protein